MTHLLRRHPFEVKAHLRRSLVLAYSVPEETLEGLLLPGLTLDTHGGHGFLVVAMVETAGMRPSHVPQALGRSFFLAGYRLFVRYKTQSGKSLRGLQVLRSETNSSWLLRTGNLLTHYRYVRVEPECLLTGSRYRVIVRQDKATRLEVTADLENHTLPCSSIFCDVKDARRFAGPMPFTFSYEKETHSVIRVEGVRQDWNPQMVAVDVPVPPDFAALNVPPEAPRLASAFYLEDVPYRWKRGIVEAIS